MSRKVAIIVDEFHLLGGQTGQGWIKLDKLARGLQAPLIINSATPNYNDYERVYCVAHVIDWHNHKGGYLGWIIEHCETVPNRFRTLPDVTGFKHYADAEEFLASLPGVVYIPDDAPDIIQDVKISVPMSDEFEKLNIDRVSGRIMASQMEKKHRKRYLQIVDPETGTMREEVAEVMNDYLTGYFPCMIFFAHSSIAEACYPPDKEDEYGFHLVTGDTSKKEKLRKIQEFVAENNQWREYPASYAHKDTLVGTATLATGTDGLDKVCDTMFIVDDTDDASLRRQLVGRILARGVTGSNDDKVAYRFVFED